MRDNFTAAIRKTLAQRAGYLCSNPDCLKMTAGPHSDPAKALVTGHAAHIRAASPGGPRYEGLQSSEERRSIENGIWLCRECGDIVDKDMHGYTPDALLRWKIAHETMLHEVRQKGYSESLVLLQTKRQEPQTAKAILDILRDRRAFWESFDAERPGRVLASLDTTRDRIFQLKVNLPQGCAMDKVLETMNKTILLFFQHVEHIDLTVLVCYYKNPEWLAFKDALHALRKSIGLQIAPLIETYSLTISDEIKLMLPTVPQQVSASSVTVPDLRLDSGRG
ncbi:hypothetical protein [Rhizobium rhizogenes]|uniref:hypothetical protein n=1 Tax=Rhizobium rhizogenes TaxID=359 RepID=UPI0022C78AB4|nr:hypothetical protein [Rhizobium rhizogenes]MCZ7486054.1 hypothetical protein [Rhizobium rhizogenes]